MQTYSSTRKTKPILSLTRSIGTRCRGVSLRRIPGAAHSVFLSYGTSEEISLWTETTACISSRTILSLSKKFTLFEDLLPKLNSVTISMTRFKLQWSKRMKIASYLYIRPLLEGLADHRLQQYIFHYCYRVLHKSVG